jgi:uncharacterized protein
MKSALALLVLLTVFSEVLSQTILEMPNKKDVQFENLKSSSGKEYLIYVDLPNDYDSSGKSYSVFYMLDPDFWFQEVSSLHRKLTDENGWSESIIIGIGYGSEVSKNRFADYSPSYKKKYPGSGNAENFQNFIEESLFPYVKNKFRTTEDRTIYGHSMGGLFATYVLFTKPTMFNKYIISSPSIWWDEKLIYSLQEKFLSTTNPLDLMSYFSTAKEKDIAQRTEMLVDRLLAKNYRGLKTKLSNFSATHETVVLMALKDGLGFTNSSNE